jgi:leucyl aminopeptidase (aminopeptidase T)
MKKPAVEVFKCLKYTFEGNVTIYKHTYLGGREDYEACLLITDGRIISAFGDGECEAACNLKELIEGK